MEQIPLAVARRESAGKEAAKKMRVAGSVPAVLYSGGQDSQKLSVAMADLEKVLRGVTGGTAFLSLAINDEPPRMAVIKELQYDYLGKKVLHADFYEVSADQELTMDIPLALKGEPSGLSGGAMLSQSAYTVAVVGKVADIPDELSIDVSAMQVGDALHARDIALPGGVRLASEENFQIVSLHEVVLTVEAPAEAAEAAEGEEAGAEGEAPGGEEKDSE
ncbi:MAG: 50S ribosomal protein L25 [Desulfarculus sp.]|jgi:large subunit ribosomal protein L25|nr:MAG: 50S ribosomal protein L25 [Desulfarculus sp.]